MFSAKKQLAWVKYPAYILWPQCGIYLACNVNNFGHYMEFIWAVILKNFGHNVEFTGQESQDCVIGQFSLFKFSFGMWLIF